MHLLLQASILALLALTVAGIKIEKEGEYLGELTQLEHDISGKLYKVDEKTLLIKNFAYDGKAPDAYFYIGTTGAKPQAKGSAMAYALGNQVTGYAIQSTERIVKSFDGTEDVLVTLPGDLKISDAKWFSVWCLKYSANMAEFIFPAAKKAPVAAPARPLLPYPFFPGYPVQQYVPNYYFQRPNPYFYSIGRR